MDTWVTIEQSASSQHLSHYQGHHSHVKMKLLSFLIFSILYIVPSALTSPTTEKFERYQALSPLAPIDLDDSSYDDLTSKPRDYYVAVILTAMEARFGCLLCRETQPEWELIAQSWNKGSKPEGLKLLFGTLDFANGKGTFQKVWAEINFSELVLRS